MEDSLDLNLTCAHCYRVISVKLNMSALHNRAFGESYKSAHPELSTEEIKLIETGICAQCWDTPRTKKIMRQRCKCNLVKRLDI